MVHHRSVVMTTRVYTDSSVAKTVRKPATWQPIPIQIIMAKPPHLFFSVSLNIMQYVGARLRILSYYTTE